MPARGTGESTLLPWGLGILDGLLAVAIVDGFYTAMSSPGIWLVPWWLAVPYGAFTAWRARAYVRRLLRGDARHVRPALEGFALMAISTLAYGAYLALRAGFSGARLWTAMFAWSVYAVPAGLFGALVAVILMLVNLAILKALRR